LVVDIAYITLTVAFFALMVMYVVACKRLGDVPADERDTL
jgi:hypothetical protein